MVFGDYCCPPLRWFLTLMLYDKKIPVFGVDATEEAVDPIASGIMTGTRQTRAEGMAKVARTLLQCRSRQRLLRWH